MMKKVLKWMGIALLAPVLLVAMLAVSLYIPPIQNWAVKKAASVASEKTGMDISVERVRLQFPLDLRLEGFRMLRQNDSLPQCKDTIADIRSLVVDVQLWPLLKKQVEVDELEVNGLRFNTTDFVDAARVSGTAEKLRLQAGSINLRGDTLRLDEAILEDGNIHVEMADSVPEDTTTSENRWKILVDKLNVELQDAKYRSLSSASELTERCRESNVLEMLRNNRDSTLKIPTLPPYIIEVP